MKQDKNLPKGIEIAQRIANKSKEKFKTQAGFASAAGMTQTAVSYYYAGKRVPSAENIPAIANALGVSIEWILTGQGPAAGGEAAEEWRLRALAAEQRLEQLTATIRGALDGVEKSAAVARVGFGTKKVAEVGERGEKTA